MRILLTLALLPFAALASDSSKLEKMTTAPTAALKNDACFDLRGNASASVLAAMRKALGDQTLRACAARNLRAANAIDLLRDALRDGDAEIRAVAVLELGSFTKAEDLRAIGEAGRDANMLVATNAVYALAGYSGSAPVPYLAAIAEGGGMAGTQAIGRLSERRDPVALQVARRMLDRRDVTDKLAAIKVLAEMGTQQDLKALRTIQATETGELSANGRGFGLMPSVSLARAAKTAIDAIEMRTRGKESTVE